MLINCASSRENIQKYKNIKKLLCVYAYYPEVSGTSGSHIIDFMTAAVGQWKDLNIMAQFLNNK